MLVALAFPWKYTVADEVSIVAIKTFKTYYSDEYICRTQSPAWEYTHTNTSNTHPCAQLITQLH